MKRPCAQNKVFCATGIVLLAVCRKHRFSRLNIEKNDFPDGCPVARGASDTCGLGFARVVYFPEALRHLPCFGAKTAGEKWEDV